MKNLTLEQANELLKTANTKQDIINILNKLNLSSPETKTILYLAYRTWMVLKTI